MSIVQFKTTPNKSLSQTQVTDNFYFHLTHSRPNFPHSVCLNRKRALQETIDSWRAFTICPNLLTRPVWSSGEFSYKYHPAKSVYCIEGWGTMPATVKWSIVRLFKLSVARFYRGLKDRENTICINLMASRWTALALRSNNFFNTIIIQLQWTLADANSEGKRKPVWVSGVRVIRVDWIQFAMLKIPIVTDFSALQCLVHSKFNLFHQERWHD